jgi:hypothetical protein
MDPNGGMGGGMDPNGGMGGNPNAQGQGQPGMAGQPQQGMGQPMPMAMPSVMSNNGAMNMNNMPPAVGSPYGAPISLPGASGGQGGMMGPTQGGYQNGGGGQYGNNGPMPQQQNMMSIGGTMVPTQQMPNPFGGQPITVPNIPSITWFALAPTFPPPPIPPMAMARTNPFLQYSPFFPPLPAGGGIPMMPLIPSANAMMMGGMAALSSTIANKVISGAPTVAKDVEGGVKAVGNGIATGAKDVYGAIKSIF